MPHETEFQQTKVDLNPPPFSSNLNLTSFRIPPILQLHIKRTWITGLAIDPSSLAQEIHKIDPRVEISEVIRFLDHYIPSDEWVRLREESLQKTYSAMLTDSERIKELIDQRYDRNFDKIQMIAVEQIDRIGALSAASNVPLSLKSIQSLKCLSSILKDTYLMQRLARGFSQGKYIHEIVQENNEFEGALKALRERLDEKIIDAQAKVLPAI